MRRMGRAILLLDKQIAAEAIGVQRSSGTKAIPNSAGPEIDARRQQGFAAHHYLALRRLAQPGDDFRELRPPGTHRAGKAYPLVATRFCDRLPDPPSLQPRPNQTSSTAGRLTRPSSSELGSRPDPPIHAGEMGPADHGGDEFQPASCPRSPPPPRDGRRAAPPPARRSRRSLQDVVVEMNRKVHAGSFELPDVLEADARSLAPRAAQSGSSRMMNLAPRRSERAISSICRWPIERSCRAAADVGLKSPQLKFFAALPASLIPTDHSRPELDELIVEKKVLANREIRDDR